MASLQMKKGRKHHAVVRCRTNTLVGGGVEWWVLFLWRHSRTENPRKFQKISVAVPPRSSGPPHSVNPTLLLCEICSNIVNSWLKDQQLELVVFMFIMAQKHVKSFVVVYLHKMHCWVIKLMFFTWFIN